MCQPEKYLETQLDKWLKTRNTQYHFQNFIISLPRDAMHSVIMLLQFCLKIAVFNKVVKNTAIADKTRGSTCIK